MNIDYPELKRNQRGITLEVINTKRGAPLLIGVTIIIVITLLFAASSGCATKEPQNISTTNIISQTASAEKESSAKLASESAMEDVSGENLPATEEVSAEKETQTEIPKAKTDIEIVHPVKETHWKENIGGIAKNIPDGYELWIIVYSPEKQQYYPYSSVTPEINQWVIKPVIIGFKSDDYKVFDIIAVLADKNAQNVFNNYLDKAAESEENIYSQGLYLIPESAKEYDRVTLTRMSSWNDNTID
ncbi:hypothetical protein [Methanosarcina sp.]|uniref:hypothetical protein n=1 Tax=Methanosarcina sp. TaxID=2213 RepID=UPI003C70741E